MNCKVMEYSRAKLIIGAVIAASLIFVTFIHSWSYLWSRGHEAELSAGKKRLPDVIIIGVKKCGTTTLGGFVRNDETRWMMIKTQEHFWTTIPTSRPLERLPILQMTENTRKENNTTWGSCREQGGGTVSEIHFIQINLGLIKSSWPKVRECGIRKIFTRFWIGRV